MAETAEAVENQKDQQADASSEGSKTTAQDVEFSEVPGTTPQGPMGSIDILLDMEVPVKASIGHAEIPIRQLLQLGPGSVLKLERRIDEPVDLFLKDARFATGKVVVVENHFAIRIEQILGAENESET